MLLGSSVINTLNGWIKAEKKVCGMLSIYSSTGRLITDRVVYHDPDPNITSMGELPGFPYSTIPPPPLFLAVHSNAPHP